MEPGVSARFALYFLLFPPVVPAPSLSAGLGFGVAALPRPRCARGQCRPPGRGWESAVRRGGAEASASREEEGPGPFGRGALPLPAAGPRTGSASGQAS